MSVGPHEQEYYAHERGDRLRPKRSSRVYWHLTLLRDKLQCVIESDALPAGETLLDYGCGNSPYESLFSAKFKRYLGADILGNARADLIIDAEGRVPSPDESFDCVLSSQVLEHVINPQSYLAEARRILKPGGALLLSTHGIWPYHPDPTDFWRWTGDGLRREIQRGGFEIISVQSVFSAETVALQLWQDATFERLPGPLQRVYTWSFQVAIGFIERRRRDLVSDDAAVYIVLARKSDADSAQASGVKPPA